jgi:hypothetical protein
MEHRRARGDSPRSTELHDQRRVYPIHRSDGGGRHNGRSTDSAAAWLAGLILGETYGGAFQHGGEPDGFGDRCLESCRTVAGSPNHAGGSSV